MTRRGMGFGPRVAKASRRFLREDSGQVLPMVTIMLVVLIGMAGLTLDVGRAYYAQRELQASTDAAALAAAQAMLKPGATPSTIVGPSGTGGVAEAYSSAIATNTMAAGANQRSTLPSTTESAVLECYQSLKAQGQPCVGNVPYNAVQVQQTSVLPTVIAWMFGKPQMTINALSTASARGGSPKPSNIAVILDTTLSEDSIDTNCTPTGSTALTEMQCSLNGLQVLLSALQPCGINQTTCGDSNGSATNSFDRVSLFTFPNVTPATASRNLNCTTDVPAATLQNGYWNSIANASSLNLGNFNFVMPSTPTGQYQVAGWGGRSTAMGYSFPIPGASSYQLATSYYANTTTGAAPATYQLTDFLSDYRTSDTSTALNPSSTLVMASGAVSGCGGMGPPNYDGVYGTYYAGVIYAAQAALTAESQIFPDAENVIIFISDGDAHAYGLGQNFQSFVMAPSGTSNNASASGTYPSWVNQCQQAVTAAQYATSAGTTFFTVAYGAGPTGCRYDVSPVTTPCATMASMASAPQDFYSDYNQSGSNSTCVSGQPVTSIAAIFASIANDLTEARLIPNNTQ